MPIPADMVKLTMQFDLNDGSAVVDEAQFGVWGRFLNSGQPSDWNDALDELCDWALTSWVADVPTTKFSPASILNGAVAGHYSTAQTLLHERKKAAAGAQAWAGSGSQSLPWAVSPCVSLYSYTRGEFIVNGKSRRGRIYMPPVSASIMGNADSAQMGQTDVDNLLGYISAFFVDLVGHTYPGTPSSFHPGILSPFLNEFNEVLQLSMDRKLDTQRRREKQQTTVITSIDYP